MYGIVAQLVSQQLPKSLRSTRRFSCYQLRADLSQQSRGKSTAPPPLPQFQRMCGAESDGWRANPITIASKGIVKGNLGFLTLKPVMTPRKHRHPPKSLILRNCNSLEAR